jgi:HlyD family secretion protein
MCRRPVSHSSPGRERNCPVSRQIGETTSSTGPDSALGLSGQSGVDVIAKRPQAPEALSRSDATSRAEPRPSASEPASATGLYPASSAAVASSSRRGGPTAILVSLVVLAIIGLSGWYLVRPVPLLIQGEADSVRIDIAARVEGRVSKIPVARGQHVDAGTVLLRIDNPELVARYQEAIAFKNVADAELARIHAGTRAETIATRKAEIDRLAADVALAQVTYDRTRKLAATQNASLQQLDQATAALQVAQRSLEQGKLSYEEALAGFTAEEVKVTEAKVEQAAATVRTFKSLVDQLTVTAPLATQIDEIHIEPGEVVAPGIPLLSLVDMNDIWLRFDLREDLLGNLKVGDRITVRIPALGDRKVVCEVRLIAARGDYADWRATSATGDLDLRSFTIRAYPVEKIAGLRPGMSGYAEWPGGRP